MKIEATALTTETAAALVPLGRSAVAAGDFTLDLSNVKQVDSAAVALLLQWQRDALAAGKKFTFSAVPPALASLATLYGMDEVLGTPPGPKATSLMAIHPDATP